MNTRMQQLMVGLFCLSVSSLTGCAFGTRQANLGYVPTSPTMRSAPTPGLALTVVQFSDQRSEKKAVGEVRNGYGMRTAAVVPDKDIAAWITQGVQRELENAGYKVTVSQAPPSTSGALMLQGDVVTVYCTAMFSYGAPLLSRSFTSGSEFEAMCSFLLWK